MLCCLLSFTFFLTNLISQFSLKFYELPFISKTVRLDAIPIFMVFQQFNAAISIYHLYYLEEPAKSAT